MSFTEAGDNISAFSILLICPPKINSGGRSDTKDPVQGTVIGGFLMPAVNKDKAVTSQSLDQGSVTTVGLQQRRDLCIPSLNCIFPLLLKSILQRGGLSRCHGAGSRDGGHPGE